VVLYIISLWKNNLVEQLKVVMVVVVVVVVVVVATTAIAVSGLFLPACL